MTEITNTEFADIAMLGKLVEALEDIDAPNIDIDWDTASVVIPFEAYESKTKGVVKIDENGTVLILNV